VEPVPITLLVDDPCPLVHVYRYHMEHVHAEAPRTKDGRPLLDVVPNAFLEAFCDVVEGYGIRGKFSIVPSPAALGDIVDGVKGDLDSTLKWLDIAKRRLGGAFDFCPEGITHDLTVDLEGGSLIDKGESVWSQGQDRTTLTPYLARALRYLKDAGIDATGVTSPWIFGMDVEGEYIAAILEAQRQVNGRARSWYFLHMLDKHPETRPWVAWRSDDGALVSVASTVDDVFWRTIDTPRADRDLVTGLADELLTRDGRGGKVRAVLDAGGWPVLLTHWQSLYSNGLGTGLAVLEDIGRRVRASLGDEVVWTTCSELMEKTLEAGTARPSFLDPLPGVG
jgi:hypothetical protein